MYGPLRSNKHVRNCWLCCVESVFGLILKFLLLCFDWRSLTVLFFFLPPGVAGDGSHPADPWASNGGAPLQPGSYGGYGGQVGPTPPLMSSTGPNNPHMGQAPYPGQGDCDIFLSLKLAPIF